MSEPGEIWGHTNAEIDSSMYKIDPEKIKTLEDVVRIIDALNIQVSRVYPNFEQIEDLLTKVDD